MFDEAKGLLSGGNDVILDATFSSRSRRETAKRAAKEAGSAYVIIRVVAGTEVTKSRLAKRKNDYSDANFCIYDQLKAHWDEIEEEHIVVDSEKDGWFEDLLNRLKL